MHGIRASPQGMDLPECVTFGRIHASGEELAPLCTVGDSVFIESPDTHLRSHSTAPMGCSPL